MGDTMETIKCKCNRIIEGYNKEHIKYLLAVHMLSKKHTKLIGMGNDAIPYDMGKDTIPVSMGAGKACNLKELYEELEPYMLNDLQKLKYTKKEDIQQAIDDLLVAYSEAGKEKEAKIIIEILQQEIENKINK